MSKRVVVTDHKGVVTLLEEAKGASVQDTLLYIYNEDGTTRAVFRAWAHVTIEDSPEPEPAPEEVIRAWNGRCVCGRCRGEN